MLPRREDEVESLGERGMDDVEDGAHERRALERHGDGHAPAPPPAPRHEGRDDGAEIAVDRVGQPDLARDRFVTPPFRPPHEQQQSPHRGEREQHQDDGGEQRLHQRPSALETPQRGQREIGWRSGRQLVQGANPTASARSRDAKSVSSASERSAIEPHVGRQYSVSPRASAYMASRAMRKSSSARRVRTPSTASSCCFSVTRSPAYPVRSPEDPITRWHGPTIRTPLPPTPSPTAPPPPPPPTPPPIPPYQP